MTEVEINRKARITRKQAAERLVALGRALAQAPKSELEFDGESISFVVADHLEWEFELEIDGDEVELEIELKWKTTAAPKPAPGR